MNTTNLFVELFIIGIGVFIWLSLIILSLFGFTWIDFNILNSIIFMAPVIAFIYVTGIVFDRLADTAFRKIDKKLCERIYNKSPKDFHYIRTYVFSQSQTLMDKFSYSRSKLRICRSWFFNFLLIGIFTIPFTFLRFPFDVLNSKILFSSTIFVICISLSIGAFYTWYRLLYNYYEQILYAYYSLLNILNQTNE